jgi:predicted ester cyclase
MSADTNVADVRAFIERASNQGDTTAFDEFLSPDFVGGRERFKGMILGYRRAFPDLRLDVHDIFGAGDKVVSRWTITGTHRRSFLGIAPTEQANQNRGHRDRSLRRRRTRRRVGPVRRAAAAAATRRGRCPRTLRFEHLRTKRPAPSTITTAFRLAAVTASAAALSHRARSYSDLPRRRVLCATR